MMKSNLRRSVYLLVVAVSLCTLFAAAVDMGPDPAQDLLPGSASGNESTDSRKESGQVPADRFAVNIRRPDGPPRVLVNATDAAGNQLSVSCTTCHATRSPTLDPSVHPGRREFHREIRMAHGNVTCLSCHNVDDYDALRLADGQRVEYADVMTLCAQCHGPQTEDYRHAAHGGMSGYWDLSQGSRTRNNCIDCHDPHAPAFPSMRPTFKPRDRFLNDHDQSESHSEAPHD